MAEDRNQPADVSYLEKMLPHEWPRLVRLCAHLSGDRDAAEDLAQETMIEAWRHRHRLHDRQGYSAWLSAIARNVSLRWIRDQGRERSRLLSPIDGMPDMDARLENVPAEQDDITVDLERDELADLLDRALSLLPRETRRVLMEKYVEELPVGAIAERLGLSAGTVAVRLHRGRIALHRVLATDLRREAASYGLVAYEDDGWHETRIWCPLCGDRHLTGRFVASIGELALRCPDCTPAPDVYIAYAQLPELMRGIKSYKPALSRLLTWSDAYYRRRRHDRVLPCLFCGHPSLLRDGLPDDAPEIPQRISPLYVKCESCGQTASSAHAAIALCLPEGQRFWKAHPRMRLQSSEVESAGSIAIVSSFASVTDSARFDVVTTRDTVEVVGVHTYP